ncbi:carbamoyl-phosphate synthase [Bacillus sp. AFS075034]|uniref:carbamoyl-phosphate synthase n=1 Tax=Bacillus sp. AFS075034 TaxID=2034281 RepID=UPI000BF57665|nr:carbamoyl-phosphate synthase [Bacillus sp. AFS075034]PFW65279.1 carbamoyl-phosphate synthase [Bacillus sp. AFS075034]
MADGRVVIETALDTSNVRRDVQDINRELGNIGNNMDSVSNNMQSDIRQAVQRINNELRNIGENLSSVTGSMHTTLYSETTQMQNDTSQSVTNINNALANIGIHIAALAQAMSSDYSNGIDGMSTATRNEVNQVNNELNQMGRNAGTLGREMRNAYGSEFTGMTNDIRRGYVQISDESRRMMAEMNNAFRAQKMGMSDVYNEQIRIQHGYFQLAQSSKDWTGTTQEMIDKATELGAAQKKVTDAQINANRLAMMGMLQQIGMMNNMSTTASRISENYASWNNPLYSANRAGLALANSIEQVANSGSSAQLALEMHGPNASMKQLSNTMRDIDKQVMAFPIVFGLAAASAMGLYGALHSANMEMNPQYAEAYSNMMEKLSEALNPMKEAFAAVMIPLYNFVAGMADLVIQFNEAHPTLAKFIQGTMMLVPALMLILSPLSIGIGYFKGLRAILFSFKPVMMPIITGFAAMSGTVWLVAAAIAGLTVGITYLWNHCEAFRNVVTATASAIKEFGMHVLNTSKEMLAAAVNSELVQNAISKVKSACATAGQAALSFGQSIAAMGKYLFFAAVDGDHLNDWITHLPEPFQNTAQAIGQSVVNMRNAIISMLGPIQQFGQHMVALGQYLWSVIAVGDVMNDWITHLPVGFQSAAMIMGTVLNTLRESFIQVFSAIQQAFQGNFDPIIQAFTTFLPNIIGMLIGGIPGLVITMISLFMRMGEGAVTGGSQLMAQLGTIINSVLTAFIGFITTYLPMIVEKGVEILVMLVQGITSALPKIVEAVTSIITTFITGLVTLLPIIIETGINIIVSLVNAILSALPQLIDAAANIINTLVDGITKVLPIIIDAGIKIIITLVESIFKLLPQILDAGIKILMALVDGVLKTLPKLIDSAIKIIETLIRVIAENLPKIIDAGVKILNSLIDGILKILPQLIETAVKLITKIVETLVQNLPKIIESGVKILNSLIDGIMKILPQLIDTAVKLIVKIFDTLIQNLPKIIDAGMKILMALIDGLIKILPQLIDAGLKIIVELTKAFIDNLPKILECGVKIIAELIKGIWSMQMEIRSMILDKIGKVMTDALDGIKDSFFNAGKGFMDMMRKGIENAKSAVLNTVKDVAGAVRDFLPFSPAKVGPLSDLDKLNFGGPISDSLKLAMPQVSALMTDLVSMPQIQAASAGAASTSSTINHNNGGNTNNITVNIDPNNMNEFEQVLDFFNTFKQTKRARG